MLPALLLAAEDALSPLSRWESFYVIVGSSGAALTGLQFVVMTLIADSDRPRNPAQIRAFGTPTIVHFCAALLVSAIASAPWSTLPSAAFAFAICGIAGVAYGAIVVRRARGQTGYTPVLEDWIWHGVLPLIAYGAVVGAAIALPGDPAPSLFVIGGAALLLLFIGIHNSWDTVTYIAVDEPPATETGSRR
jgi:hypothetical protein